MNHSDDQLGLEATKLLRKSLEVSGSHTKLLKRENPFCLVLHKHSETLNCAFSKYDNLTSLKQRLTMASQWHLLVLHIKMLKDLLRFINFSQNLVFDIFLILIYLFFLIFPNEQSFMSNVSLCNDAIYIIKSGYQVIEGVLEQTQHIQRTQRK